MLNEMTQRRVDEITKAGDFSGTLNSVAGHPRTDEVAALDDKISLYIHACEMEQALRGVMAAIEQNNDYWEPNAKPPFNPDAHIQITMKASECESVFASLPNSWISEKETCEEN